MKLMIKIILLFSLFFCSLFSQINSRLEYINIDYPSEFEIPIDFNEKMISTIKINFKYFGKEIIANNGNMGEYIYSKMYSFTGDIRYFTKDGIVLPSASNYFKKYGLNAFQRNEIGTSPHGYFTLFRNGHITSAEICFLSPYLLKNAGLYEPITKKELSLIEIIIDDIIIDWELEDCYESGNPVIQKGKFKTKVNSTIRIKLIYQKDSVKSNNKKNIYSHQKKSQKLPLHFNKFVIGIFSNIRSGIYLCSFRNLSTNLFMNGRKK